MSRSTSLAQIRQELRIIAKYRCGYCLSPEVLSGIALTLEHIIPLASGGTDEIDNLWLSCRTCNEKKGVQTQAEDSNTREVVPLFNPRTQRWSAHFQWDEAGTQMSGLTPVGRATIVALDLNRELLVLARERWVQAGWHPPKDV